MVAKKFEWKWWLNLEQNKAFSRCFWISFTSQISKVNELMQEMAVFTALT